MSQRRAWLDGAKTVDPCLAGAALVQRRARNGATMAAPLLWNTLDEAAWLATGIDEEWNARRVLDLAVRIQAAQPTEYADGTHRNPAPTLLSAAPPREVVVNRRRRLTPKPATGEPCPIVAWLPWHTLPLFALQAAQLRLR